jgi:hypothetical protein
MVLGNTMVWRKLLHILLRAAKHLLALSIFSRVNIFGYFLYNVTTVLEDYGLASRVIGWLDSPISHFAQRVAKNF